MLDPSVDPRVPVFSVLRRRIALATGFLLGASAVAALVHATRRAAPPPPPPPPAAPVQITLTAPPPLVVTIEKTEPAPVLPAQADAALGCPAISRVDRAIGKRAEITGVAIAAPDDVRVVAAADAPVIAATIQGKLYASDDDGATWDAPLGGIRSLAAAPDGTLYAIGDSGLEVREDGDWKWRTPPTTEPGKDRIGALGKMLVWLHDADAYSSMDHGRTWKVLAKDAPWQVVDEPLFAWDGGLYELAHYSDMCGIDDTAVERVDLRGARAGDMFHNHYDDGDVLLVASNEVDPTWKWKQRCRTTDANTPPRCEKAAADHMPLLQASVLEPREGARALAKWGQSLVELCPGGARQIYRQYPFAAVAAVDWVGRPLSVSDDGALYRWSPVHGWRKLVVLTPPEDPGSD